ncbi:MAG: CDP-alcohol phosphatidyltransferase family protein [Acidobacteriota bacterium]|nr:MAG: CDP-alcohol phosphatidyltransferase family protein [Acidobacteriota bacterium]
MKIPWPDLLTGMRILMVAPITWALGNDHWGWVFAFYVFIPVTDLLDGHLARILSRPTLGPKFDAIADIIFGVALICWVYWKATELRGLLHVYLPILLVTALVFFLLSYLKTNEILLLHLWTGKLTGWTGFFWFLLVFYTDSGPWVTHIAMIVPILFYLESSVFVLKGHTAEDARSAFF